MGSEVEYRQNEIDKNMRRSRKPRKQITNVKRCEELKYFWSTISEERISRSDFQHKIL